jgi:thiamine-phosphate pyrophosphorylase
VIDANLNRTKEGLRVCEEIARFILNDRALTASLKEVRHGVSSAIKGKRFFCGAISGRQSDKDAGKEIYADELKRKDCFDVFFANIQRVKESIRVLEEFSKLKDRSCAVRFKDLRYSVYGIEKKIAGKIKALSDNR